MGGWEDGQKGRVRGTMAKMRSQIEKTVFKSMKLF